MSRAELNKLTTKELCEMANINYALFRLHGFNRDNLIEIILTPNY